MVTLDTLDATQLAHTQELMAEQREKEKLAHTVHVYAQSLRSVEAERDDLRDAVSQLVEKGAVIGMCLRVRAWLTPAPRPSFFAPRAPRRLSRSLQRLLTLATHGPASDVARGYVSCSRHLHLHLPPRRD